jgi:hypothetical protein
MSLARRSKLRPSSVLAPIPEAPKSGVVVRPRGLMLDDRPDALRGKPLERRREDCTHLRACEWEWCANQVAEKAPIGAQAKCPEGCVYFEPRDDREPTTLDRTLKITTRRSA